MNTILLRIDHLFEVPRWCHQLQMFVGNWPKYWKRTFVWTIHLLCVRRLFNQRQIFPQNLEKHMKRILVRITHLSCVNQSRYQVQRFAWDETIYLKRTLVWTNHLICVVANIIDYKSLITIGQDTWMNTYSEFFIYLVFVGHVMNSKSSVPM
jgi:hypothetical protein